MSDSGPLATSIPPSFHGNDLFYMLATFGSLTLVLLAANWLWRVVTSMLEDPQPLWSAVTIERMVRGLLMLCTVMRVTPKVVLLLQWPEITPAARLVIAQADKGFDSIAIIPFFAAWLIDYLSSGPISRQLKALPEVNALPGGAVRMTEPRPKMVKADFRISYRDLIQPAKIAAGSFVIALAVVYLQ